MRAGSPKIGRGRPRKHDREIVGFQGWIERLVQSPEARSSLMAEVRQIVIASRERLARRLNRITNIKTLHRLHRRNVERNSDSRTLARRRARIEYLAERLQKDLVVELPIAGILPLTELSGADYAKKYFCRPKLDDELTNIARHLIIGYSIARYIDAATSDPDEMTRIIRALPKSFRRAARPTFAVSENLAGLMSSLLYDLRISGDVCAILSGVVRGMQAAL